MQQYPLTNTIQSVKYLTLARTASHASHPTRRRRFQSKPPFKNNTPPANVLSRKPPPLAVIRNRRLNNVALLVLLRLVQFSSVRVQMLVGTCLDFIAYYFLSSIIIFKVHVQWFKRSPRLYQEVSTALSRGLHGFIKRSPRLYQGNLLGERFISEDPSNLRRFRFNGSCFPLGEVLPIGYQSVTEGCAGANKKARGLNKRRVVWYEDSN